MSKAIRKAEEVLAQFKVSRPPVPVFEIAKALGASVVFEPYRGDAISGMLHRQSDTAVIGINSLEKPARQRFSLAHEIGHLLLHKGRLFIDGRVNFRSSGFKPGVNEDEVEANVFAAHLLMPEKLVRALVEMILSRDLYLRDEEMVAGLAKQFEVSKSAMQFRLSSLGLIQVV